MTEWKIKIYMTFLHFPNWLFARDQNEMLNEFTWAWIMGLKYLLIICFRVDKIGMLGCVWAQTFGAGCKECCRSKIASFVQILKDLEGKNAYLEDASSACVGGRLKCETWQNVSKKQHHSFSSVFPRRTWPELKILSLKIKIKSIYFLSIKTTFSRAVFKCNTRGAFKAQCLTSKIVPPFSDEMFPCRN